jgi:hypothetical protein
LADILSTVLLEEKEDAGPAPQPKPASEIEVDFGSLSTDGWSCLVVKMKDKTFGVAAGG